MLITDFRVKNYKCFAAPESVTLSQGLTLITGQNNAGKTAFLEALSLQFLEKPHRTLKTVPQHGWHPESASFVDFTCVLGREELMALLRNKKCMIPVPDSASAFAQRIGLGGVVWDTGSCQKLTEWFLSQERHCFKLRRFMASGGVSFSAQESPSDGLYEQAFSSQGEIVATCDVLPNGEIGGFGSMRTSPGTCDLGVTVGPEIASRIYRFSAERRCAGTSPFGDNTRLHADASNLPEVLNSLQHNPADYQALNRVVAEVLPQVKWVSVRPTGTLNEVLVWGIDPSTGRSDLAIPLSESGTGIGQVLSILYVVVTSSFPQTILIDEPQSFLHPGAARKLIQVLKRYSHHQFVIATHSPSVISEADPESILMLRAEGESTITALNARKASDFATSLIELGVRLSDVYGADNILWVEGPTEEICFPKILRRICGVSLMGTAIIAVKRTGDFECKDKRQAERIFEIYGDLSKANNLMPPAIAFLFDRECLPEPKAKELKVRSKNLLVFTERRTYENNLLHPEAIATLLNKLDTTRPVPLTVDDVDSQLQAMRTASKYYSKSDACSDKTSWLVTIDGARVLADLFSTLTDSRVAYKKTQHSVSLTEWLLDHAPDTLKELAETVRNALSRR